MIKNSGMMEWLSLKEQDVTKIKQDIIKIKQEDIKDTLNTLLFIDIKTMFVAILNIVLFKNTILFDKAIIPAFISLTFCLYNLIPKKTYIHTQIDKKALKNNYPTYLNYKIELLTNIYNNAKESLYDKAFLFKIATLFLFLTIITYIL